MLVHLREVEAGILYVLQCNGPKTDPWVEVTTEIPPVPKNVRCSVFNDIPPICQWDWWLFHLNNGHWLIRTQARAISAKEWDVAFFQWSIAWYICKKIGVCKCWISLHPRNASFDGGESMWRRYRISLDTTKARLIWIKGYFRWHFIILGVEQIVHFPQ